MNVKGIGPAIPGADIHSYSKGFARGQKTGPPPLRQCYDKVAIHHEGGFMAIETYESAREGVLALLAEVYPEGLATRTFRTQLAGYFDDKQIGNALYKLKADAQIEQGETDRLYYLTAAPDASSSADPSDSVAPQEAPPKPAFSDLAAKVAAEKALKAKVLALKAKVLAGEAEVVKAMGVNDEGLPAELEAALRKLEAPAPSLDNADLKLTVLNRLSTLLEPSIAEVLLDIKADLINLADAGQA